MRQKIKEFRLIVGLGNPGPKYSSTYHNVGHLAVDKFIEKISPAMTLIQKSKQKNFEFFKFANGQELIFIKPLTFMNESGEAVAASLRYFQIKPEEMLIIHDDSDIELGKSKISFGRGAAGHHGIESIINSVKTKNFSRLRIGIRKKEENDENGRKEAGELVLQKISLSDKAALDKLFNEIEI